MPASVEVVTDQSAALARIDDLLDRELWCERRRRESRQILAAMAWAMDWDTGLVAGITRQHLAQLAQRSATTVSRLWHWAQDIGLLARVEEGASAKFLGASVNRSAVFVFTAPTGSAAARTAAKAEASTNELVDGIGNPPTRDLRKKPLERRETAWPTFRIPTTPTQRRAAACAFLARVGLDPRKLNRARLYGLLRPWWDGGACVTGLLWAIDHHPDRPDEPRGDALRGARDPLAVLGHRLSPWSGRLSDLPANLHGLTGDYQAAQSTRLATLLRPANIVPTKPAATASSETRAAAKTALHAHLATLHHHRRYTAANRWARRSRPIHEHR